MNTKAATGKFHFVLNLETPVDKGAMSSTGSCLNILIWPAFAFVLEASESTKPYLMLFSFMKHRCLEDEVTINSLKYPF